MNYRLYLYIAILLFAYFLIDLFCAVVALSNKISAWWPILCTILTYIGFHVSMETYYSKKEQSKNERNNNS